MFHNPGEPIASTRCRAPASSMWKSRPEVAVSCCHLYEISDSGDSIFAVDPVAIRFGPGALKEAGAEAHAQGLRRVGVFTDPDVAKLEAVRIVTDSLRAAGVDLDVYAE